MIDVREHRNDGWLHIRTPEGVCFAHRLAGPVVRAFAASVDLLVVWLAASLIGSLANLFHWVSANAAAAVWIISGFALQVGYTMVSETLWRGQTVGKRVFRLRVMDAQGLRLRWSQTILRNILRAVDMLPAFYLVGGVAAFISRRRQRLGDLAAGTVVVMQAGAWWPDLGRIEQPKYNSVREHPRLVMQVRQGVSPEEAALALQAIARCEAFDPEARIACFAELAAHLRTRIAFPEEVLAGLSDEQLVRDAVDVIFSPEERPGRVR